MDQYPELICDKTAEQLKGELIGSGTGRNVYAIAEDPSFVIKEVHLPNPGANIIERYIWNNVAKTSWKPKFGEICSISESGRYLIMEKLDDVTGINMDEFPDWLSDRKPANFGVDPTGKVKVRDYAHCSLHTLLEKIAPNNPLQLHLGQ